MEKKRTILIIDDDEFLVDMYSVKFKQSGFLAEHCLGVREALEKIRSGFSPDAVLLDIVMPNMDGFEFLQQVKKENLLKDCKIIMLTNLGQKEDVEKGIELGADDYIIKADFTPSEIVKKINTLLEAK